ncbi:MAG: response regulator [Sandaracinaceae bacterium]|nr:response regulator [Sandaracinaceae bacterium]
MTPVVVYVDDEPALCRVFALILKRAGAEARTFTDPLEALEFLATSSVAAVICDYRMPTMTGVELRERLASDVPFYLVSGDLNVRDQLGEGSGITGVIDKPFRPETLLDVLRPHLDTL